MSQPRRVHRIARLRRRAARSMGPSGAATPLADSRHTSVTTLARPRLA